MSKQRRHRFFALALGLTAAFGLWLSVGLRGDPEHAATRQPAFERADTASARLRPGPALPGAGLAGAVRNDTGVPIAGARVCATCAGASCAQLGRDFAACVSTDTLGRYALRDLRTGSYALLASARGHAPAGPFGARSDAVRVALEELTVDFVLHDGGAAVSGRVFDATGGVIVGAWVLSLDSSGSAPVSCESDHAGRFELFAHPGPLVLTAYATGYARAQTAIEAPDANVDITLSPSAVIEGRVVRARDGKAVPDVAVSASRLTPAIIMPGDGAGLSDSQGRFRMEVSPGQYDVIARTEGFFARVGALRVGIAEVRSIDLVLLPAASVIGRVIEESTQQPCAGASVVLTSTTGDQAAVSLRASADRDGSARFEGVPAGHYRALVDCPGHAERADYPPLRVESRDVDHLVWGVSTNASIRGRLVDSSGAAIANEVVSATSLTHEPRISENARTLADGSFAFSELTEGEYELRYPGANERDSVIARAERDPKALTLVGAQAASLRVRVASATGARLGPLAVYASGDLGTRPAAPLRPGEFELYDLVPGSYSIVAYDGKNPPVVAQAEAVRGSIREVSLTLPTFTGAIRGRVLDEQGHEVSDAWVRAKPANSEVRFEPFQPNATLSSADGTFKVGGLGSGTYELYATLSSGEGSGRATARTGDNVVIRIVEANADPVVGVLGVAASVAE